LKKNNVASLVYFIIITGIRKTNDTLSMQPDKSSVFFLTVY